MKQPLISLKNFSYTYPSQINPTLKNINLTINQGEKVLILGPTGSGKTTLAQALKRDAEHLEKGEITGSIEFLGENLKKTESYELSMEAKEEMSSPFGFDLPQLPSDQSFGPNPIHDWMSSDQVKPLLEDSVRQMSAGERVKVNISGMLINQSPILIFDNFLTNLDPKAGNAIIDLIDDIHQSGGNTIIMVEHRLEDILYRPVDRVIVVSQGHIVFDGSTDRLLKADILVEVGIEEPLWVKAMKYAGVNLNKVSNIDNVNHVWASGLKEQIEQWVSLVPQVHYPNFNQPLLELKSVSYRYLLSDRKILDNVSLTINRGETLSLVGGNGAGKSTLSQLIYGVLKPQEGKMIFDGRPLSEYPLTEQMRRIGYIWQNPKFMLIDGTVEENIRNILDRHVGDKETLDDLTVEALKLANLEHFRNWDISDLSFGQQKRLTVSAVLTYRPDLLILDNPTAGQDFNSYSEFMNFMLKISRESPITIIYITHDIEFMLEYSERAVVMAEGKIVIDSDPITIATNRYLTKHGNLKETSLLTFAEQIGLDDAYQFIRKFIDYDRVVRQQA